MFTSDVASIAAWDKDFKQHNIVLNRISNNGQVILNNEVFTVAPNPTKDGVVKVNIVAKANKDVVFELANIYGKTLLQQTFEAVKGDNTYNINLNKNGKLAKGLYFLKAVGLANNYIVKIVIELLLNDLTQLYAHYP